VFNGWYNSASGKIGDAGANYTITSTITLYAQWKLTVNLPNLGANGSGNDGDEMSINGIACVLVKAGTFTMGGSDYGNRSTQQVTLTNDYWISKYPIKQSQYQAVMGYNPSYFSGNANNPVESVTWNNANDFAQAVDGRLPTEAQWEFAARGGNKSEGYIYSGSNTIGDVAWYSGNSGSSTHQVGQKLPNELGIYDMSGNVWEWSGDWRGVYSSSAVTDPTGPSTGDRRIIRGGNWGADEQSCRVAIRYANNPSIGDDVGFRVVFPRE
jgi:uncharacterized repeat protein (TIGR02543 family)